MSDTGDTGDETDAGESGAEKSLLESLLVVLHQSNALDDSNARWVNTHTEVDTPHRVRPDINTGGRLRAGGASRPEKKNEKKRRGEEARTAAATGADRGPPTRARLYQ